MTREDNNCVDCQLPCLFTSCPYYKKESVYCDCCGEAASYSMEGADYCAYCTAAELNERFQSLPITERAAILGVDINTYW